MLYLHDNSTRRFGHVVHGLGVLLTLGSAVAAYFVFYAPKVKAAEQAYQTIAALEQSLRKAPAIQRQHAQLSSRLQAMEDRLKSIHQRIPKESRDSEFLADLTGLAEEVGFTITDLTPSAPQEKTGYSQMEISVTGRAAFESVCRFVHCIEELPRLTKVVGLNIEHDANAEGEYPATVTVAIFFRVHGVGIEESGNEP